MPLETEFYEFDDEIERVEEATQDVAEQLAPLDDDNPAASALETAGNKLQSQLDGLRWATSEWAVDGVTLAGLTGGEYGYVEDEVDGDGQGKARVYFVAKGSENAPYIEEGMSEDDRIAAAAALPIGYLRWADARIYELMSVSGNGEKRFGDWLAEAQEKASSAEE